MTYLFIFLMAAVLTGFTIWSRKDTEIRISALIIFVMLGFWTVESARKSYSHPATYLPDITVPSGTWDVLAYHLDYGNYIYVWLDIEGKPRSYVLTWDADKAQELQDRMGEDGRASEWDEGAAFFVPEFFDGYYREEWEIIEDSTPRHNDFSKP